MDTLNQPKNPNPNGPHDLGQITIKPKRLPSFEVVQGADQQRDQMTIDEKAETIAEAALEENTKLLAETNVSETGRQYAASLDLARACALLTSTVKAEREEGKTMVRRWKNGNRF